MTTPAFQPNAFQPTAFQSQAAAYRDAFAAGFQPRPAFQRIGGIPPTQDGKSGYWRLFFYNMQEEALKEKKDGEKVDVQTDDVATDSPKPTRKLKRAKRVRVSKSTDEPTPIRPFKLAPVIQRYPTSYEELASISPLPDITFSVVTLQSVGVAIIDLEAERTKRRKQARRRAAAFLLMAA